jgi:hypothetical protein
MSNTIDEHNIFVSDKTLARIKELCRTHKLTVGQILDRALAFLEMENPDLKKQACVHPNKQ